ncbi:hypothetical protein Acy02nite_55460 [Actinoplanes cyaneus]|uniref:DUF3995 domain-containing protein n=1 Tax=Actinoplanes cyaneus TaxID=52696 RepID=A0A919IKE0_9ACTN|nr:hypothetical protein [Actinoplanes cyaneus]MCW2140034.1 hypothetical protein [Actinoplanes cyaneus]GID67665.1 hypothetical protein Acy02nite_55460 [Actinoplanes cyaneus]
MSLNGDVTNRSAGAAEQAVPPPSRRAVLAGWVAALAATVGFMPLHVAWAAGIPLFADRERFEVWHADGGGTYLWTLNALALLPAVLAFALIRPWGLVLPRWVPGLAGRRVPRLLLIVPGYGLVVALSAYTVFALVLTFVQWGAPEAIFSPWTGVYGIPHFIVWVVALAVATHSYSRRTRALR